ncbi:type II secretion system F family protein [Dietzia cercidiphylli]|uniref:type II secretion system F family protein n=1 Tax=Dietzia cercidiphylli TaxID=498199 RepID=UPI00223A8774|nr:type II secretion system F family protein [Dietzia cercidiphylli]MCT1515166.1 type II secretion system F family protein [Dietzia cercidiphylli]
MNDSVGQALASPAGVGVAALSLALLIGAFLVLSPRPGSVPRARRRPGVHEGPGIISRTATAATSAIDTALSRRGAPGAGALERAGVKMGLQDFVFLVGVAAVVTFALGLVAVGPVTGLFLAALTPIGAKFALDIRASRRRAAFADQLDDSLQLMASSLRAGHSLLQALASVAREAEEPTSEEFARIINETRVGRDLAPALEETARRMGSEDFEWVTQAIAINREVGGNLAEVLDGVGHTIRERNQIRRQVKALAAEGKLSAYVLMALPFGISGFLFMSNPEYISKFTEGLLGYTLIGVSVVLLVVGALWLRKVVNIRF